MTDCKHEASNNPRHHKTDGTKVCCKCGRVFTPETPETERLKVYVAGPMSGLPEHNFPAFREAADALRHMGHQVVSPVEMDEAEGFDAATASNVEPGSPQWCDFLSRDVRIVAAPDINALVVLNGWEKSRGAALEVHVARELGKPIYRLRHTGHPDPEQRYALDPVKAPTQYRPPSDESILEEAARLVHADRGDDYGHPADDFARTAGCWRSLFGWDATAERVALAMVCVKLSRLVQTPDKRDSVTDVAGYAQTYSLVMDRNGRPLR